jgi:hypothetical protein
VTTYRESDRAIGARWFRISLHASIHQPRQDEPSAASFDQSPSFQQGGDSRAAHGPANKHGLGLFEGYGELPADIKREIAHACMQMVLAVNKEMIRLYWRIGRLIIARQRDEGWGA